MSSLTVPFEYQSSISFGNLSDNDEDNDNDNNDDDDDDDDVDDVDDNDSDDDSKGDSRAGCYDDEDELGVCGCEQNVLRQCATTDITPVGLVRHIFIINSFLLTLKHWLAYDDLPPSWNFTERRKLHFSGLGTPPKETNHAFCQVWN